MASDQKYLEFVLDQIENAGEISAKIMFGEYGIYSNGKLFGLICDNRLFIKPTISGRTFIKDLVEAPPFPLAKMYFLIEDKIENREWLNQLIRITCAELPEPKLKPKKKKKNSSK